MKSDFFEIILILLTLINPYLLGDPDNFIPPNPLVTPAQIQREYPKNFDNALI